MADQALQAEPSIGLLLSCNVVLRYTGDGRTTVSALDPATMVGFSGNPALEPIAAQARLKLATALDLITPGASQ